MELGAETTLSFLLQSVFGTRLIFTLFLGFLILCNSSVRWVQACAVLFIYFYLMRYTAHISSVYFCRIVEPKRHPVVCSAYLRSSSDSLTCSNIKSVIVLP